MTCRQRSRRGDDDTALGSGLLHNETVAWVAGEAPLALAWSGGTAPFRVALAVDGPSHSVLLDAGDIPGRDYRSPPLDLAPGS